MIKAACISLGFVCLITAALPAPAQNAASETDAAVREAVHRQAFTIELRQKLVEARKATAQKDVIVASKAYENAYDLTQKIGTGVEAEAKAATAGIVWARMELAQQAQKRGDYKDADTQIKSALRVDPKNQSLLGLKRNNDEWLAGQAGRIPSAEVVDRIPTIVSNRIKDATLVQDGKLLFELGKWDEAEAKLKQAMAEDPAASRAAAYYLNLISEARFRASDRGREVVLRERLVEVQDAWHPPVKRDLLPVPNPAARTNLIHTGAGRQSIISKLDRIQLNDVKYDGLELGEVIRNLSEETKKRDPDKVGVNFLILPDTSAPTEISGAIDPNTGLPLNTISAEAVDLATVRVKINPALNNVRLAEVLDAIVKTAERPIKYSIEDYAIVFSIRPAESPQLLTRTFKVDPNTFYQGLEGVGSLAFGNIGGGAGGGGSAGTLIPRVAISGQQGQGGGGGGGGGGNISFVSRTNTMEGIQATVRQFFQAAGVDLAAPKAMFFNDRKGILFVRATLQDLDTIEAAIQTLNVTPPQVNIKARMAEIKQDDTRALGFDWLLGNVNLGKGVFGQGGTAPSYVGSPSVANPVGQFPGGNSGQTFFPSASDNLLTAGLRNLAFQDTGLIGQRPISPTAVPALATITGILTDPQFRMVINAMEQRNGIDLLSAPEVTTLSGRQAQIDVAEIITVVTRTTLDQTASSNGVASTITYETASLPFGPVLDVVPYVSADEYSIQMTLIPTITEFVGYDNPGNFIPTAQSIGGSVGVPLAAVLALPRMRSRQVTTSVVVWDGQTVVLGGLISEDSIKIKDKVPVLGDLPLFGRLFRSESSSVYKKNLLIFVTPTIIDPAGNRVHSDEEMPFAQSSYPSQRSFAPQP